MPLKMCPGCGQNVSETARRCPACGWESSTHRDLAANRFITWFTLYALGISVAGVVAVNHEYGQSLLTGGNDLVARLVIAILGSYVVLKLLNLRRHRKIWMASLGTGVLLTAGMYISRTLLDQGALPMVSLSLPVNSPRNSAAAPSTQPATTQPAQAVSLSAEDFAPLMPIAAKAFASVRHQPFTLRSELDAAGVPKMLAPANLVDARRVGAARARITRLYGRLDDYKAMVHQSLRDALAQARSADVLDEAKARFIATLQKVGATAETSAVDFIELQRRMLQQTDDILKLAQSAAGKAEIRNGALSFTQKQDQAQYENLRRQLAATDARQQKLLRGFLASNDPSMQRLTSALSHVGPNRARSVEASAAE